MIMIQFSMCEEMILGLQKQVFTLLIRRAVCCTYDARLEIRKVTELPSYVAVHVLGDSHFTFITAICLSDCIQRVGC
jgi:hypothetical protein